MLGVTLLMLAAVQAGDQRLEAPSAALEHDFSRIGGVRELPDGRLLVSDWIDETVSVVDLARQSVDGAQLSWSLGGYPSPNLELFQRVTRGEAAETVPARPAISPYVVTLSTGSCAISRYTSLRNSELSCELGNFCLHFIPTIATRHVIC